LVGEVLRTGAVGAEGMWVDKGIYPEGKLRHQPTHPRAVGDSGLVVPCEHVEAWHGRDGPRVQVAIGGVGGDPLDSGNGGLAAQAREDLSYLWLRRQL